MSSTSRTTTRRRSPTLRSARRRRPSPKTTRTPWKMYGNLLLIYNFELQRNFCFSTALWICSLCVLKEFFIIQSSFFSFILSIFRLKSASSRWKNSPLTLEMRNSGTLHHMIFFGNSQYHLIRVRNAELDILLCENLLKIVDSPLGYDKLLFYTFTNSLDTFLGLWNFLPPLITISVLRRNWLY